MMNAPIGLKPESKFGTVLAKTFYYASNRRSKDNSYKVPVWLNGMLINLDGELSKAILEMNNRGYITSRSCQGLDIWQPSHIKNNHHTAAQLSVSPSDFFPDELVSVWKVVGFTIRQNNRRQLQVIAALSGQSGTDGRIMQGMLNKVFRKILSDWSEGLLDISGKKYLQIIYDPVTYKKARFELISYLSTYNTLRDVDCLFLNELRESVWR